MRRVMTFGTFDCFHLGHEAYLRQAKALGDELVVVIARDATVKKIKQKNPEWDEKKRKKAVEASGIPDKVVLGNPGDKYEALRKFRPSVIALGYDQFVFTYRLGKFLIDEKIDAKIVRLNPFRPELYKTSHLQAQHDANYQAHA